MTRTHLFAFASVLTLSACDATTPAPDAAAPATADASGLDAVSLEDVTASLDAGATSDVGALEDAPVATDDARASADAARPDDAWRDLCPEGLGAVCDDTVVCSSGFECMVGRCAPQARQICGGFAGARCTEPGYTQCMFFSGADFGPCLTPEERRCICDDPGRAAGFDCG